MYDAKQPQPVFKVMSPIEVWYCDKPLKAPGAAPKKILVSELEKIVGDGFRYSEDIYSAISSKLPFQKNSRPPDVVKEILKCLRNPLIDKLVICKIDDEVGHGVFARLPIKFNEVVAIYSGEFKSSTDVIGDTVYALDAALSKKRSGYNVDAKKIGGIARFFQHLPHHADILAEHQTRKFKTGRACIEKSLGLDETLFELTPEEASGSIEFLFEDAMYGHGEKIKEMMNYNRDPSGFFEVENIELSISWHEIAIANLRMSSLILKDEGIPIIYFYAEKDILVGEPVGFSYTLGYWASMARLPRLFDLSGYALSRDLYKYTKMPFTLELTPGNTRAFFYERRQYEKDKVSQWPVTLFADKVQIPVSTMSFFSTRKILAQNNIVSVLHSPCSPNNFMLDLKKLLPGDVQVEIYEHDPDAVNLGERYIFDVVCMAPTLQRWAQLTVFIRQDPIIGEYCTSLQQTREIIIKGVNIHPQEMFRFIKSKVDNAKIFFANEIPEDLLPKELPRFSK